MFHRHHRGGHPHHGPSHHGTPCRGPSDHDEPRRFARGGGHGPDIGHHGRHRHGRGGGHSGSGRLFAQGDLRLVVLHLIAEKPRHGYELIKAIEELTGSAYSPSPGVLYPTLTLLEELGQITPAAEEAGSRRLREITEEGRAALEANRDAVTALLARMAEAGRARGGEPPPQVLRAMENLRLALRLRLAQGSLSEDQARAIAAALDAAATSVERA